MIEDQLRRDEAAYKAALAQAEAARAQRAKSIAKAHSDGLTHEQIAKVMGLTRSRISQIAPSNGR